MGSVGRFPSLGQGVWTDEDAAAFKAKTDVLVKQFDAIEVLPAKEGQPALFANGALSLGENIADQGGFITEAAQFGDELSRLFFMRIVFTTQTENGFRAEFKSAFQTLAAEFDMTWKLHNGDRPARLLLSVSYEPSCC